MPAKDLNADAPKLTTCHNGGGFHSLNGKEYPAVSRLAVRAERYGAINNLQQLAAARCWNPFVLWACEAGIRLP